MMIKTFSCLLLSLCCIIFTQSCKNQQPDSKSDKIEEHVFPTLPLKTLEILKANCDYIDYIFYELPISMSHTAAESIAMNIHFISDESISVNYKSCPRAIARIAFQVKGEIIADADLFLSERCSFYLFLENNKPKFANKITTQGISFLQSLVNQYSGSNVNQ